MGHQSSAIASEENRRQIDLTCELCNDLSCMLEDIDYLSSVHGKPYGFLVELVLFHKDILR